MVLTLFMQSLTERALFAGTEELLGGSGAGERVLC